jgi:hypothetical protein
MCCKKDMADIPQRLYKAMKRHSFCLYGIPHLDVVMQSGLERGFRYFKVSPIKAFRDIRHASVDKVFTSSR